MDKITKIIQAKRPLSADAKDKLLQRMSEAKKELADLQFTLDELKEQEKEKKEQIAAQHENILSLINEYDVGYMSENCECEVRYVDNMTQFINVKTGEVEQEYQTSDKEQMMLNIHAVDAETIIREASANED